MHHAETGGRARRGAAQRGEELRKQLLAAEEAPLELKLKAPRGGAKRLAPPRSAAELDGFDSSDGEDEEGEGGRRRGAALTPEEREAKRLRRLMRNRASAQQARERKRDWMAGIEERASTLEERVAALNNQVNALDRTNWTLRSLIKTATASAAAAPRSEEPVVIMVRAPQTFLFDESGEPMQPAQLPMPVMAGGAA